MHGQREVNPSDGLHFPWAARLGVATREHQNIIFFSTMYGVCAGDVALVTDSLAGFCSPGAGK